MPPIKFKLRFKGEQIPYWAERYSDPGDEGVIEIGGAAAKRGFLKKEELAAICKWKSLRNVHYKLLTDDEVEEVTRVALRVTSERLRVVALLALPGVSWPTASAILHLAHHDPYPVLDVRALWSLGIEKPPPYKFEFWQAYVEATRSLAEQHGVDMRTLDRALWQHSKEKQA